MSTATWPLQTELTEALPRLMVAESTTSSWIIVAACIISTAAAPAMIRSSHDAVAFAPNNAKAGRSLFPLSSDM